MEFGSKHTESVMNIPHISVRGYSPIPRASCHHEDAGRGRGFRMHSMDICPESFDLPVLAYNSSIKRFRETTTMAPPKNLLWRIEITHI